MTKQIFAKLLLLVLVLATACDRPSSGLFGWGQNRTADIVIEQIAETGQPGQFTLTGTTNLPDQTLLTVSAVRRIGPSPSREAAAEAPRHAILDRKSAVVKEGRWQTQLQLWETSAEGTYQENWQTIVTNDIDPASISSSVDFLATLEPIDLARSSPMARADVLESTNSPLLNFTPDGEPYLRAIQSRVVALPNSALTAARLPQVEQETWEGRLNQSEIDTSEVPQTPFMDADNVLLPEQNRLR